MVFLVCGVNETQDKLRAVQSHDLATSYRKIKLHRSSAIIRHSYEGSLFLHHCWRCYRLLIHLIPVSCVPSWCWCGGTLSLLFPLQVCMSRSPCILPEYSPSCFLTSFRISQIPNITLLFGVSVVHTFVLRTPVSCTKHA